MEKAGEYICISFKLRDRGGAVINTGANICKIIRFNWYTKGYKFGSLSASKIQAEIRA